MEELSLKTLFDYQRLERNTALQTVIDEVLDRYAHRGMRPLSDDEIALAAGGTGIPNEEKPQESGL